MTKLVIRTLKIEQPKNKKTAENTQSQIFKNQYLCQIFLKIFSILGL